LLFAILLVVHVSIHARETRGTVLARVTDQSGAVIVSATVPGEKHLAKGGQVTAARDQLRLLEFGPKLAF
jgi:hypothetical protein